MIKAVLFDYGHILMDVKKEDKEKTIKKFGLTSKDYEKTYEIYLIYSRGKINSDEEYVEICSHFIGKPVNKEFLNALHEIEKIDDNNIEIIKKLRGKYKLAVVANNVEGWVLKKLKEYGIKDLFDIIIVSSSVGVRKPDPMIFQPVLNELKVGPEECIFVSDELNQDLSGAKAIGIKTVWLKKKEELILFQPDYTIKSLNEIMEIMK